MNVGFDFGTTFSTLCVGFDGSDAAYLDADAEIFIPTQLFITEDKRVYIGGSANVMVAQKVKGVFFYDLKRWIGVTEKNFSTFKEKIKPAYDVMFTNGELVMRGVEKSCSLPLPLTTLIQLFFTACFKLITEKYSQEVLGCVCSVPADFDTAKRSFLINTCRKLDVKLHAIINEPTAAALGHFLSDSASDASDKLFVYDFGGGTFDVSLMFKKGYNIFVESSFGDNRLGGRDVDLALSELIVNRYRLDISPSKFSLAISKVKEDVLTDNTKTEHLVNFGDRFLKINVTEEDVRNVARPFIERTFDMIDKIHHESRDCVGDLLLIGGSSKLPGILEMANERSYIFKTISRDDYRSAVAKGCYIRLQTLSGESNLRLSDAAAHFLSDERIPWNPLPFLAKGEALPATRSVDLSYPNTGFKTGVNIYEGESNRVYNSTRIFSCDVSISDFVPKSGKDPLKITYSINASGTLSVTALSQITGNQIPLINMLEEKISKADFAKYKFIDMSKGLEQKAIYDYYISLNRFAKNKNVISSDPELFDEETFRSLKGELGEISWENIENFRRDLNIS
ncbi:HSP70h [Mint vein banding-associated virus]|uniref:HSP70h n=1 Tax=Mint vein banding-associated virus TaxID=265877 RepID=Q6QCI1_9CLOS|nr:HSP70h [Mint vein banding-associated virus]AAS57941.2 HSP70h [Mint vein banding-associated virus]